MTWLWVGLFLLVMFALGIVAAVAFRKPHAPDRRTGRDRRTGADRRRGDRRAGPPDGTPAPAREIWTQSRREAFRTEHGLPTPDPHDTSVWTDEQRAAYRDRYHLPQQDAPSTDDTGRARHSVERRQGDRRKGERRKKQVWWPKVTVVSAAAILSVIGVVAYGESMVPSIFNESNPALAGSGWARCGTPITWSVDTTRLSPADAQVAVAQMTSDFGKWGAASGLTFKYVGEVPTTYNDTTFSLTSTTHPSNRHIYVAFLHDADSSMLDTRTVGISSPTKVFPSNKNIVEGSVVLEIEYVKEANLAHRTSLYLHELGHALGLGHGGVTKDAMYYLVETTNDLSPADIAGIKALTKVCPTVVPNG